MTDVILHVIVPVAVGALVYLAWRSTDLYVFSWARAIGGMGLVSQLRASAAGFRCLVPNSFLFSAPDGLWAYGLVASIGLVWGRARNRAYQAWFWAAVVVAIFPEFCQIFGLVQGTFDISDLIASGVGIILARLATNKFGRKAVGGYL